MDKVHKLTDKQINKIDKQLSNLYSSKTPIIKALLMNYNKSISKQVEPLYKGIKEAKDQTEEQKAKAEYLSFFRKQMKTKEYKALSQKIVNETYLTNEQATKIINDNMPYVYAMNYNYINDNLNKDFTAYNFNGITEKDVKDYASLDYQQVNKDKDNKWNEKTIKKSILAGAILGYSAEKIFKKLPKKITKKNNDVANMHSSGMMTYAENKGRFDCMNFANDNEFRLKKQWVSTLDNRTRHTHAIIDEQVKELDEKFDNGLMYPRDPNGEPAEVCNCRCDIIYVRDSDKDVLTRASRKGTVKGSYKDSKSFEGTETVQTRFKDYEEWAKWKLK